MLRCVRIFQMSVFFARAGKGFSFSSVSTHSHRTFAKLATGYDCALSRALCAIVLVAARLKNILRLRIAFACSFTLAGSI